MKKCIENANLALPYIVHSAKMKETLTYKELAEKIHSHPRALSYTLGYIRDEICRKRGLPMLSVIVVNKETRLLGRDFLPEGTESMSKEEYINKFIELRDEVFKYSKWDELLKELDLSSI
ncbi:MAG TPA: hypothetical protein GXX65_07950 [Methanosarcina sp.]|nr:hypothetical protein [Methanosarcina sp.]